MVKPTISLQLYKNEGSDLMFQPIYGYLSYNYVIFQNFSFFGPQLKIVLIFEMLIPMFELMALYLTLFQINALPYFNFFRDELKRCQTVKRKKLWWVIHKIVNEEN